ncbi:MAG: hypothetical protein HYY20_07210 [Candidatus Tectomicrobia bacterium]|uniref:Uncharacterized protein n=1 Tax=Tectimicrobiota bacterium TaxID=2528274 RepID=A0A932CNM3_UNCTE|nr:hypothetical protein [Candidatus Tectomicrobia bacterium]
MAPAPYYGVNIFDVPAHHWEAVCQNVRQQIEAVKMLGGRSHLWSVRDHGPRKRVLWINRYPQQISMAREEIRGFVENPIWTEFCKLIDSFQWFLVTEQPSTEP